MCRRSTVGAVSILYWRCPSSAWLGRCAASAGFNSLLEMQVEAAHIEARRRRVGFNSLLEMHQIPMALVNAFATAMLFQFSIGDAEDSRRVEGCRREPVSILYWRCAAIRQHAPEIEKACFNSLLEMRRQRCGGGR